MPPFCPADLENASGILAPRTAQGMLAMQRRQIELLAGRAGLTSARLAAALLLAYDALEFYSNSGAYIRDGEGLSDIARDAGGRAIYTLDQIRGMPDL